MHTPSRLLIKSNETPEPVTPPTGGGGGGGGGIPDTTVKVADFIIEPTLIKVKLKQGASQKESIKITNIGDINLNIKLTPGFIKKFITLSEDSFSLEPRNSKIIYLDIHANENEIPDVYTGKIIAFGGGITKSVKVIIQVEEITPFFSIETNVIEKRIMAPDDVGANIHIEKTNVSKPTEISLFYALRDFDGNIIISKEDNVDIYKETDLVKVLRMPEGYPCVEYLFYAKASFRNRTVASADNFTTLCEQIEIPALKFNWQPIILIILIILVCIIILFAIKQYHKMKHFRKVIKEAPEPSDGEKTQVHHLCKECGVKLKSTKKYCHKCGTKH
jgi:uncharacterized protein YneF (UPF0154 family)